MSLRVSRIDLQKSDTPLVCGNLKKVRTRIDCCEDESREDALALRLGNRPLLTKFSRGVVSGHRSSWLIPGVRFSRLSNAMHDTGAVAFCGEQHPEYSHLCRIAHALTRSDSDLETLWT